MRFTVRLLAIAAIALSLCSCPGFLGGTGNQVDRPTVSPPAGTYYATQVVTISCATSGATISYTLDGRTPTHSVGTQILAGDTITISATTTLKAIAFKDELDDSGVLTAAYTIAPSPSWISQLASYSVSGGQAIMPLAFGRSNDAVYQAGCIATGTYDFGNGVTETISAEQAGFLAKYSSSGVCQWVRVISADADPDARINEVMIRGLAVAADGSVAIVGYIGGNNGVDTYSLGDGSATLTDHSISAQTSSFTNYNNAFVAKYSGSGTVEWAKTLDSTPTLSGVAVQDDGESGFYSVVADESRGLYVCGEIYGSAVQAANISYSFAGRTISSAYPNGGSSPCILRFDYSTGQCLAATGLVSATEPASFVHLIVNSASEIWVSMHANTGIYAFGSVGCDFSSDTSGSSEGLLVQYSSGLDSQIQLIPLHNVELESEINLNAISSDSSGDIYLAMAYSAETGCTVGMNNVIIPASGASSSMANSVARFDHTTGNATWVKEFTTTGQVLPSSMSIDDSGGVFASYAVAGRSTATGSFTVDGNTIVTGVPQAAVIPLIVKLDSQGNYSGSFTMTSNAGNATTSNGLYFFGSDIRDSFFTASLIYIGGYTYTFSNQQHLEATSNSGASTDPVIIGGLMSFPVSDIK